MATEIASYDTVIVGAGPGGISAACAVSGQGRSVAVVDSGIHPGGQIWRGGLPQAKSRDARIWLGRFESGDIDFLSETQVVALGGKNELITLHKQSLKRLKYESLILATGARESFIPFPGWTHPGVMGAGGIQAAVKSGMPVAGKRIVVAGTGPLLLAVAASLKKEGARISAIVEQAPYRALLSLAPDLLTMPKKLAQAISLKFTLMGVPFLTNSFVSSVAPSGEQLAVTLHSGGSNRIMECDFLACGYHLVPSLELPRLLGCRVEDGVVQVDSHLRTSCENVFAVGELLGIGGVECALLEGSMAGFASGGDSASAHSLQRSRLKARGFAEKINRLFAVREELKLLPTDDTVVCRCEDVSHGQLKNSKSWREAKLYTRCGMGPCQGRICGSATQALYGWTQETARPPLFPVPATFWAQVDNGQNN